MVTVTLVWVQAGLVSPVPHSNTDDAVRVAPVPAASLVSRLMVCVAPFRPVVVSGLAVGAGAVSATAQSSTSPESRRPVGARAVAPYAARSRSRVFAVTVDVDVPGHARVTDVVPDEIAAHCRSSGVAVVNVPLALRSRNPHTCPAALAPDTGTVTE